MSNRRFIIPLVILALAAFLALPAPGFHTQTVAAQEGAPAAEDTTTDTVSYNITYQGRLVRNGSPVNDSCEMTFEVYTAEAGLDPMAGVIQTVEVINGLFTVELDFNRFPNIPPFNGWDRFLEVTVECGGVTETLSPRQKFTPASSALSMPPGSEIIGPNGESLKFQTSARGALNAAATNQGECAGILLRSASFIPLETGVMVVDPDVGVSVSDARIGFHAETDGSGTGVLSEVEGGNAVWAQNNGSNSAIYAKNDGSGTGITVEANTGAGANFISHSGNILGGWKRVERGKSDFNLRFRVANSGNVYADGSYQSPAADFAELLPAVAGLEPGDVLVVGLDGGLIRSSEANASNVAGVFSTRPAFLGGMDSETWATAQMPDTLDEGQPAGVGKAAGVSAESRDEAALLESLYEEQQLAPLAIAGIVPVKVSAENGVILPGDLLTTAATPGHAMKALPVDVGGFAMHRPGTIIGKALEGLDEGTGLVRVLVTLQ